MRRRLSWDKAQAAVAEAKGGTALEQALDKLRCSQRMQSKAVQAQEAEHHVVLKQWDATLGEGVIEQALKALPFLRRHDMQALPSTGLPLIELQLEQTQQRATTLASWACAQRGSNIGSSLEKVWVSQHHTVSEVEQTDVARAAEPQTKVSPCAEAGVCLCTGRGVLLKRLRNALFRDMKQRFKGLQKQELGQGLF